MIDLNDSEGYQKLLNKDLDHQETFGYLYKEVSAKTGENIKQSLDEILGFYLADRKKRKIESKRERDFGTTDIMLTEQSLNTKDKLKKKCCKT